MEKGFLDKVEDNAAYGFGLREHNKRRTDGRMKPSNYSTETIVICLIYSMSSG
ncbi:hypothetical protein Goklo_029558 [Gossypium klotzschianum]|uniref:Uncharacterized protein n=1 Tax=Gossypium klotzschianum TaxID=34286 RepID=A0A7J8W8F0_9ROSI|nr:hypothetical protein [Gossypium klotzschianum]